MLNVLTSAPIKNDHTKAELSGQKDQCLITSSAAVAASLNLPNHQLIKTSGSSVSTSVNSSVLQQQRNYISDPTSISVANALRRAIERTQKELTYPRAAERRSLYEKESVLLNESDTPRGMWKLARIQATKREWDGKIRTATIQMPNGKRINGNLLTALCNPKRLKTRLVEFNGGIINKFKIERIDAELEILSQQHPKVDYIITRPKTEIWNEINDGGVEVSRRIENGFYEACELIQQELN
ncbi:unnamed protein product [Onchocerca flexuosa]|uniref:DUF5641 domain-containing protein n=1 Tax=Onchocerca flexuosa TaxID=387005 RepID=A0A183I1L5_9BILA|nr:unnamed protein product [Onchocerca flexuosa]